MKVKFVVRSPEQLLKDLNIYKMICNCFTSFKLLLLFLKLRHLWKLHKIWKNLPLETSRQVGDFKKNVAFSENLNFIVVARLGFLLLLIFPVQFWENSYFFDFHSISYEQFLAFLQLAIINLHQVEDPNIHQNRLWSFRYHTACILLSRRSKVKRKYVWGRP